MCAGSGPARTRKDRPLLRPRTTVALVTLGILAAVTAPAAQSAGQRSSQAAAVTAILVDVVVRDRAGQPDRGSPTG